MSGSDFETEPTSRSHPAALPAAFHDTLGLEIVHAAEGRSTVRLVLGPAHLNGWQAAHGGVVMALLDVAMAQAARSLLAPSRVPNLVTVEMKTSFMRPAEGVLRVEGLVLERTTTMAFCEATVFNAAGRRCAHATGTFKYLVSRAARRPEPPAP